MSTHHPECEWNDETRVNRRCICPALRACEQRARDAERRAIFDDEGPYEAGFNTGVQAARDAVDNVPLPDVLPPTVWQAWIAGNAASIAAIDALRSES